MTRWVALLRGVNVGGNRRLAMADLRAALEDAGFTQVRTVLQSGNAVFTGAARTEASVCRTVEEAIRAQTGMAVDVVARKGRDLEKIVAANPFVARGVDPRQLHVVFAAEPLPERAAREFDPEAIAPDEAAFGDRVVYLRLPNGVMGAKVPDLAKKEPVTVTMRTWNTVTKLRDLAAS